MPARKNYTYREWNIEKFGPNTILISKKFNGNEDKGEQARKEVKRTMGRYGIITYRKPNGKKFDLEVMYKTEEEGTEKIFNEAAGIIDNIEEGLRIIFNSDLES